MKKFIKKKILKKDMEDYLDQLEAKKLAKEPRGKLIPLSEIIKKYGKANKLY